MKTCTKCGETKPLDDFHKHRRTKDGHRSHCKVCHCAAAREYAAANRERKTEYGRAYREANKDRIAERKREWCMANRERLLQGKQDWYLTNKERIAPKKREYGREYHAVRRTADPLWNRLNTGRERARKAGTQCDLFTSDELLAYWREWGIDPDACTYCGGPFEHIDHVHPFALGGSHTIENCVPACQSCNRSKNNRPLYVWRAEATEKENDIAA